MVLAYRSSDEEGNLALPSPFLADVSELLAEDWPDRRRRRMLADVVWPADEAPTERELARAHAAALAPLAGEVPSPIGALSEVALEHVRHRQILSAGALESYAGCPVRWLIERELQPVALEPDPDPLVRGGYMHSVIEQVLRRLGGPVTRESLPRALEILDEVMAHQPHAIAPGGGVGGAGGRGARSRRRPAPVPRARGPRRARLAAVRPRAPVRLRRRRRRSGGVAPAAGARRRRPGAWDRRPRRRR